MGETPNACRCAEKLTSKMRTLSLDQKAEMLPFLPPPDKVACAFFANKEAMEKLSGIVSKNNEDYLKKKDDRKKEDARKQENSIKAKKREWDLWKQNENPDIPPKLQYECLTSYRKRTADAFEKYRKNRR
jgi:hypothetical protein